MVSKAAGSGRPAEKIDERLVALIHDGLASGRFASGSQLPTERALVETLGIPRSAVRRGLAVLETQGRITRHVGRGTFVARAAAQAATTPLGLVTSPVEIMDVRLMLEPQVAASAAGAATATDIEAMLRCTGGGEAAQSYEEFERWDGALHRAIAVATHNEFLLRLVNVINAARDEPLWGTLKRRSFTVARRRDYERDHRRIVEALAQRDGELARRSMRDHIIRVRANLLEPAP